MLHRSILAGALALASVALAAPAFADFTNVLKSSVADWRGISFVRLKASRLPA